MSFSILFANSSISNNYKVLLEKKRIDYLNSIVKLSLKSTNNDFSWENNQLNIRNSNFLHLLEENYLSTREKDILRNIETNITKEILQNNQEVSCENIFNSPSNSSLSITRTECIDLEIKVKNYYESAYYSVSIPRLGILREYESTGDKRYIDRIKLKDRNSKKEVYKSLEKVAKLNRQIDLSIRNMTQTTLSDFCDKIMDNENSFLSKANIARSIVERASVLNDITTLNKCSTYLFSSRWPFYVNYSSDTIRNNGISLSFEASTNLLSLVNNIISDLNGQVSLLNTQITNKSNQITNHVNIMNSASCPLPPATPTGFACVGLQTQYNNLTGELASLQDERNQILSAISDYQTIANNVDPAASVVGVITYLRNRAVENHLNDLINRINKLNFYINDYILHNGTAPSKIDLQSYNQIDTSDYASYDSNIEVNFIVDMVNYTIEYTNLGISMDADKDYIRDLYQNHLSLKQRVLIDANNMNMTIPMNMRTSNFLQKVNNIPAGGTLGTTATTCSVINVGVNLYEPNGSGFFNIHYCNSDPITGVHRWFTIATFEEDVIETNLNNNLYLAGKKLYISNGTKMKKNIVTDTVGSVTRIKR